MADRDKTNNISIDQVAANLAANPLAAVATLCEPIEERAVLENPNAVKVVADAQGLALYFSRAPSPWPRYSPMQLADSPSTMSLWANGG